MRNFTDKEKLEFINYYKANKESYEIQEDFHKHLGEKYSVSGRTVREWLKVLGLSKNGYTQALYNHRQYLQAKGKKIPKAKYYLLTAEQNKTPYNENLLRNMEVLAEYAGGEILVALARYQNPTSLWKNDTKVNNEGWSRDLEKYHVVDDIKLNNNLRFRADIKIRPTAVNPLSGFNSIGGTASYIIPHSKLHFETMAMPKGYIPKVSLTTGMITYPNYTDSKSGSKAKEKHKLGFTFVEIVNDEIFYIRQIEADESGNFKTLDLSLDNGKITKGNKVEGIIFGDTHGHRVKKSIDELNDSLVERLEPNRTVFHDITDGESVNNHIKKKPFEQFERYEKGQHLISWELNWLKNFIESKLEKGYKGITVVKSNHDDRFDRYLDDMDWKKDIPNAKEYMKYSLAKLNGEASNGVVPYFLESHFEDKIKCLSYDEPCRLGNYDVSMHGHIGVNGSRGSLTGFNKVDIPTISAHGHSTMRKDDTIIIGKNTEDDLGYNIGVNTNSDSNAIVHTNGIAEVVLIIEGKITQLWKN